METAELNNILLLFYRTKQIFGLAGDEVKQRATAKNSEFSVRQNAFFFLSVQMWLYYCVCSCVGRGYHSVGDIS